MASIASAAFSQKLVSWGSYAQLLGSEQNSKLATGSPQDSPCRELGDQVCRLQTLVPGRELNCYNSWQRRRCPGCWFVSARGSHGAVLQTPSARVPGRPAPTLAFSCLPMLLLQSSPTGTNKKGLSKDCLHSCHFCLYLDLPRKAS